MDPVWAIRKVFKMMENGMENYAGMKMNYSGMQPHQGIPQCGEMMRTGAGSQCAG